MLKDKFVHLVLSLAVGGSIFLISGKIWVFVAAVLVGIFVDVDHFLDYFIYKRSISLQFREALSGVSFKKSQKAYIIFHGYEYLLIFLIIALIVGSRSPAYYFLIAISLSLLLHYGFDVRHNRTKWQAYSIIYRAMRNFNISALGCTR